MTEVLLTKEQSDKLNWQPTSGASYTIPKGKTSAYRMDYGINEKDEAAFVKFSNSLSRQTNTEFGFTKLAKISSLKDTDFAADDALSEDTEINHNGNITHYVILTDEEKKEIFGE